MTEKRNDNFEKILECQEKDKLLEIMKESNIDKERKLEEMKYFYFLEIDKLKKIILEKDEVIKKLEDEKENLKKRT